MATIVKNDKGFLVLRLSQNEIKQASKNSSGTCDSCQKQDALTGFYVAVLNDWLCPNCYHNWYAKAVHFPEDHKYENEKFKAICNRLGFEA
jgi:hypothetical protein